MNRRAATTSCRAAPSPQHPSTARESRWCSSSAPRARQDGCLPKPALRQTWWRCSFESLRYRRWEGSPRKRTVGQLMSEGLRFAEHQHTHCDYRAELLLVVGEGVACEHASGRCFSGCGGVDLEAAELQKTWRSVRASQLRPKRIYLEGRGERKMANVDVAETVDEGRKKRVGGLQKERCESIRASEGCANAEGLQHRRNASEPPSVPRRRRWLRLYHPRAAL